MKKICILCLAFFPLLAACEKKEEPAKQQPQIPSAVMDRQRDIAQLHKIVTANPGDVEAWIRLGNILMDTGRCNEAVYAYEKALELNEKNVNARVDMGTCYMRIGLQKRAVEEYKKAIAISPRHPNAHRNLGVVLTADPAKKAEAKRALEEYLRLSPDAPDKAKIKQYIAKLNENK